MRVPRFRRGAPRTRVSSRADTLVQEGEPPVVEEEELAPPPPPPPRPLIWPWLLLLLVLVVGGLIALWLLTRDDNNTQARPVVVPDVVGQRQNAAVARLNRRHLAARIASKASKLPAGTVFAQDPSAGTRVTRGSAVTLSVSAAQQVVVPNVAGKTAADAVALLRQRGLNVQTATVTSRRGNGLVVSQSPAAGTTVAKGSTELIRVSRGLVRVPNVVGQRRADAVAAIRGAKLVPSAVTVPSTQPKGTVVAQAPGAGKRVPQGSKVRLNVSSGAPPAGGSPPPPPPPASRAVPDLTGLSQAQAQKRLNAARFKAVVTYVTSDEPQESVVTQSPEGGTTAKQSTRVTINASLGPNPGERQSVPSVLRLSPDQATTRLRAAGFKVQQLTQLISNASQDGSVVDEQPAGGESVPAGSTVTIYVGRIPTS